ncbi:MAG: NAD(P) transhydrogenase subunit alpha [Pseudomonadota bacterium]
MADIQATDIQTNLSGQATHLEGIASQIAADAHKLAADVSALHLSSGGMSDSFLVMGLTIFVLACFVGYYVVWRVTPALHSPLMAITNAISSVIIVGALMAAGPSDFSFSQVMGFLAVVLASINIFGGFIVTRRMLAMFKKKG